ncbi:MAG: hypothetical protein AB4911_04750 [Oscillochloridaceae bacterium umkhey_bin13]
MASYAEPAAYYEILVAGKLDEVWADWFSGLTLRPGPTGTTLLAGYVADQAALHGHLACIRDLGLPLLAVLRRSHPGRGP